MMIDTYGKNKTIFGNQYFGIIVTFLLFIFFIGKIYLHKDKDLDSAPINKNIVQTKNYQTEQLKPLSGILTHTAAIGTADNPTIDGGFINAADGLPVIIPTTISSNENTLQKTAKKNAVKNSLQKQQTKTASSFRDDWATSSRVKQFLRNAAKNGKLAYVLDKTEEKGLPASVAVVPMVESNYQANVTSNKGAGGIWQLMPAAARDYGIKNDDRYEFEPSTKAALALLQNLHKQFGSWELAFAAYNAGADRVGSALQKKPRAQSVEDLDLPKETKDYVKHIKALNKTIGSL